MRDLLAHSRKYKIDIFATRKILFIAENGSLKMTLKKRRLSLRDTKKKKVKMIKRSQNGTIGGFVKKNVVFVLYFTLTKRLSQHRGLRSRDRRVRTLCSRRRYELHGNIGLRVGNPRGGDREKKGDSRAIPLQRSSSRSAGR